MDVCRQKNLSKKIPLECLMEDYIRLTEIAKSDEQTPISEIFSEIEKINMIAERDHKFRLI
jgi:hypothetical protein